MDYAQLTKVYLKIRDKRGEIKKAYEAEDNALKDKLKQIEAAMLKFLIDNGMDSSKTEAGTFYKQEEIKPAGSDWEALYEWIKEHDAWDALERRIKTTFITAHMEENDGALPPGVSIYRENVVRVRRPS